jgi:hypothetical protein
MKIKLPERILGRNVIDLREPIEIDGRAVVIIKDRVVQIKCKAVLTDTIDTGLEARIEVPLVEVLAAMHELALKESIQDKLTAISIRRSIVANRKRRKKKVTPVKEAKKKPTIDRAEKSKLRRKKRKKKIADKAKEPVVIEVDEVLDELDKNAEEEQERAIQDWINKGPQPPTNSNTDKGFSIRSRVEVEREERLRSSGNGS